MFEFSPFIFSLEENHSKKRFCEMCIVYFSAVLNINCLFLPSNSINLCSTKSSVHNFFSRKLIWNLFSFCYGCKRAGSERKERSCSFSQLFFYKRPFSELLYIRSRRLSGHLCSLGFSNLLFRLVL